MAAEVFGQVAWPSPFTVAGGNWGGGRERAWSAAIGLLTFAWDDAQLSVSLARTVERSTGVLNLADCCDSAIKRGEQLAHGSTNGSGWWRVIQHGHAQ
jgi:hypothetical protein